MLGVQQCIADVVAPPPVAVWLACKTVVGWLFVISGNKPKWLPYEIELPKHRRRPVAGRPPPRAGSQERERGRATPDSARDGPRDTREGVRRREGRGGGGGGGVVFGRESSERERAPPGSARRSRREPGDKAAETSEDHELADSNKPCAVETSQSDKGICTVKPV